MDITELKYHLHNGTDSPKIDGNNLLNAPQLALTSEVVGTLTSGGANNLKTADQLILVNMQTRINELETKLKDLHFIL